MKMQNGKTTIASFFALIIIGFLVFAAFILISSKIKSDTTQKEITESILRLRATDDLPPKAINKIITTLESKGYILENDDRRAIEVYLDRQKRTVEIYYSYSYEMNFILFKHLKFIEVEESRSTDKFN
jgi:hypothetical protein